MYVHILSFGETERTSEYGKDGNGNRKQHKVRNKAVKPCFVVWQLFILY